MTKIKGLPKGTSVCNLKPGQLFALGTDVYVRMATNHMHSGEGTEKVNALKIAWGKMSFIPWQAQVIEVTAKFKAVESHAKDQDDE